MMFFDGKDKKTDEPKKRSILGLLFNPRIDRDIAPLRESVAMFVRMIASVFAMYRLFPKDHPAMNDLTLRLTLREVIGIAYSNLKLTRETLPQTIVFFAVVGVLAFTAFFFLTFFMSLFMGTAHAQVFESPVGDQDWGYKWIDYLFLGKAITGDGATATTSCAMQQALGQGLHFYSNAILILAGIMLMYHLGSMVAETAHTGKPMGRANQIWAPIRLVVAIGLLVPISAGSSGGSVGSCTVTGYNTGQYIVIQVGKWGSGLASNIWNNFLSGLDEATTPPDCSSSSSNSNEKSPSCITVNSRPKELIVGLLSSAACVELFKHYLSDGEFSNITVSELTSIELIEGKRYIGLRGAGARFGDFSFQEALRVCGGVDVPEEPKGPYAPVYKAQLTVIKSYFSRAANFAAKYIKDQIPNSGSYNFSSALERANDLKGIITDFQNDMERETAKAMTTADKSANDEIYGINDKSIKEGGWMLAGAWFNNISRTQAARVDSLQNALPEFISPIVDKGALVDGNERGREAAIKGVVHSVSEKLGLFNQSIGYDMDTAYLPEDNNKSTDKESSGNFISDIIEKMMRDKFNPIVGLLNVIDWLGSKAGVWGDGALALKFGNTLNPLAEVSALGHNFVTVSLWSFTGGAIAYGFGNSPLVSLVGGAALGYLAMVFFFIGSTLFGVGVTLGYIVPLYPFYRFFFGIIQWALMLFEAIVSMPLFALAHLNPYGEGLAGQQAKYGYSVLMQLLLRPALMIFGLVAGFVLFSVAISFLNMAFLIAAKGTGSYQTMPVVAKLIYSVVYAGIVFILANQAFSTVGLFPQQALQWLGMQGAKEENLGDTKIASAAAGIAAGKVASSAQEIAKAPGDAFAKVKDRGEKARALDSDRRFQAALAGKEYSGEDKDGNIIITDNTNDDAERKKVEGSDNPKVEQASSDLEQKTQQGKEVSGELQEKIDKAESQTKKQFPTATQRLQRSDTEE